MRFLEIAAADLGRRDVRGDREHRDARAVAVEQAIDEVQIARPAAARADGELAGQMRLGAGRERRDLLVPDMDPLDLALPAQRVGQAVEAIADDAIDPLDARRRRGSRRIDLQPSSFPAPVFAMDLRMCAERRPQRAVFFAQIVLRLRCRRAALAPFGTEVRHPRAAIIRLILTLAPAPVEPFPRQVLLQLKMPWRAQRPSTWQTCSARGNTRNCSTTGVSRALADSFHRLAPSTMRRNSQDVASCR